MDKITYTLKFALMQSGLNIEEIVRRILSKARGASAEYRPIRHCFSHHIQGDFKIHSNYPPYHIATQAGFAVSSKIVNEKQKRGEVPAMLKYRGHLSPSLLKAKEISEDSAYSVEVGDFLPDCFDCVVQAEIAKLDGSVLLISEKIERFANILVSGSFASSVKNEMIKSDEEIDATELAILYSQLEENIQVTRKPTVGLMLTGPGLADYNATNIRKNAMRELLTPIFSSLNEKMRVPFVSLGFQNTEISEIIPKALEQVEFLLLSGLFSDEAWGKIKNSLKKGFNVVVDGLPHPLGRKFLACVDNSDASRWAFAFSYHPVFAFFINSCLLMSLLKVICGEPNPKLDLNNGEVSENVTHGSYYDEIWVAKAEYKRNDEYKALVKPICPITIASLIDLSKGNCFVLNEQAKHEFYERENVKFIFY